MPTDPALSYLRVEPQLTMVAYAPLLKGGYVRRHKLDAAEFAEYDHPGTPVRAGRGPVTGAPGPAARPARRRRCA
jgi:hypothetical protein